MLKTINILGILVFLTIIILFSGCDIYLYTYQNEVTELFLLISAVNGMAMDSCSGSRSGDVELDSPGSLYAKNTIVNFIISLGNEYTV